jgi:hypothetical protein
MSGKESVPLESRPIFMIKQFVQPLNAIEKRKFTMPKARRRSVLGTACVGFHDGRYDFVKHL